MDCIMCKQIETIMDDPFTAIELKTGYAAFRYAQRFKGYTLFICKQHATELHQLAHEFKMKHLEEMSIVAQAVHNVFHADKMNYELLGNAVEHIHWHIIPRKYGELPENQPIWRLSREELDDLSTAPPPDELRDMVERLKAEIQRLLHAK